MDNHESLAEQFEAHRSHLQSVAYRMLGSLSESDDAVQAAWLNLSRTDMTDVENLGGWLTTVVARICLDMLRTRKSRREDPLDDSEREPFTSHDSRNDPEQETLLADSVGIALLVVLDALTPAERLAFVLHDIFAMPFDAIAPIVDRSEPAVRQLASRARRRVQGADMVKDADVSYQREVVNAFLTASREGSFDALLAVLDPDVVFKADAVAAASAPGTRGAAAVAKQFMGRARGARAALVNGSVGVIVGRLGRLVLVLKIKVADGKITEIEAIADPAQLRQLHLSVLDG